MLSSPAIRTKTRYLRPQRGRSARSRSRSPRFVRSHARSACETVFLANYWAEQKIDFRTLYFKIPQSGGRKKLPKSSIFCIVLARNDKNIRRRSSVAPRITAKLYTGQGA